MREQRPPRPITPDGLERAALAYLERFASSVASLRRVLMRRVERAARHDGSDPAPHVATIDTLIARLQQSGLLDDRRFAEAKAASLHRQGRSIRRIRDQLGAKGIQQDDSAAALDALIDDVGGDTDLRAACALARRRRLGPWRTAEARALWRDRDLAALGRGGFDYQTARRIVDAPSVMALLEEID
ncbi:MAG: RecX family transcriptional regulator [Azospirillaceae bacterium]|nr:RecX family transcriptional regulator [Azospirillaceae bacterium]